MRRLAILVALGLLFHPSLSHAQTGTGRISGVIKDASGAVVPGVTVVATQEETGIHSQTVTTDAGLFVFASLPVGPYTVKAELQGFRGVSLQKNLLTVGADLNLTIVLEPGNLEQEVVVSGESPVVQTTESSLSTLVSKETIVALPLNGRNPLHLIGLVPGVVGHSAEATSSGGTATHYINGDRGRGITTTQDGIDISDPVIPRGELTNSPVNPEALQEFRVITSNAKAEYGRSAGGQVELVTRSGTNSFNGTLYEFLRNTALDANSYFNEQQGLPKEVLRRNQFGGGAGWTDSARSGVLLHQLRRHAADTRDEPDDHRADGGPASRDVPIRDAGVRGRDGCAQPSVLRGRVGQPAGTRLVLQLRRQRSPAPRSRSCHAGRDAGVPAAPQRFLHG